MKLVTTDIARDQGPKKGSFRGREGEGSPSEISLAYRSVLYDTIEFFTPAQGAVKAVPK